MFPFYAAAQLGLEAQRVIELRLVKLAWGGHAAWIEANLMVSEKVVAALEAAHALALGGSAETVIGRLREHVAANTLRLTQG